MADDPAAGSDPAPGTLEAPHPNGARTGQRSPRPLRTRLLAALAVVVTVAWGWALWYSLNRPSPEPLDDASDRAVRSACSAAADDLRALGPAGTDPAGRAGRIEAENEILTAMVAELGRADPSDPEGAEALSDWRADWSAMIAARARYAGLLRDGEESPRLALPIAGGGTKPVTVRMDQYADSHDLAPCRTDTLQVEVVEGGRVYDAG